MDNRRSERTAPSVWRISSKPTFNPPMQTARSWVNSLFNSWATFFAPVIKIKSNEEELKELVFNEDFLRPRYQDQIELRIGTEKQASAGHPLMFCGLFKVQTPKHTPHQLTVTATGIDFASRIKEKRTQSYSRLRLLDDC